MRVSLKVSAGNPINVPGWIEEERESAGVVALSDRDRPRCEHRRMCQQKGESNGAIWSRMEAAVYSFFFEKFDKK